jgi:hypothetical protein
MPAARSSAIAFLFIFCVLSLSVFKIERYKKTMNARAFRQNACAHISLAIVRHPARGWLRAADAQGNASTRHHYIKIFTKKQEDLQSRANLALKKEKGGNWK